MYQVLKRIGERHSLCKQELKLVYKAGIRLRSYFSTVIVFRTTFGENPLCDPGTYKQALMCACMRF